MRTRLLLPVLFLAACVDPAPDTPGIVDIPVPAPEGREPDDLCGASELQYLRGQDRAVLETIRFGVETRIVGPDMAVTADYRADRLTITYDRDDVIDSLVCT
jgi:hypothetical protein